MPILAIVAVVLVAIALVALLGPKGKEDGVPMEEVQQMTNKGIRWTGILFWAVAIFVGLAWLLGTYGPGPDAPVVPNYATRLPTSTPVPPPIPTRTDAQRVNYGLASVAVVLFGIFLVIVVGAALVGAVKGD